MRGRVKTEREMPRGSLAGYIRGTHLGQVSPRHPATWDGQVASTLFYVARYCMFIIKGSNEPRDHAVITYYFVEVPGARTRFSLMETPWFELLS